MLYYVDSLRLTNDSSNSFVCNFTRWAITVSEPVVRKKAWLLTARTSYISSFQPLGQVVHPFHSISPMSDQLTIDVFIVFVETVRFDDAPKTLQWFCEDSVPSTYVLGGCFLLLVLTVTAAFSFSPTSDDCPNSTWLQRNVRRNIFENKNVATIYLLLILLVA
jgi:hypothetical protein